MSERFDESEILDPTFRNGSMPVVGILLGFSLSFVTRWATNPLPWEMTDTLALVPIIAGIALQLKALSLLLQLESLRLKTYNRARKLFMTGIVMTAAGSAIAIGLDVLQASDLSRVL